MNKYVVIVEGENISLKQGEGAGRKSGLFTTRRVEAHDVEEAEQLAVELVRQELVSTGALCNEAGDPPAFSIEESYEVESFEGYAVPGIGFSIYDM